MPLVVFITGAGRGLGHALAQAFLDAGDYVVATTRNPTNMSFTNAKSANYLALKLDVVIPSDITSAFDAAVSKFGRIDVVINNAAHGLVGPLETLTEEQIQQQFDANFFSVASITKKAVETMRGQKPSGGRVIQIGSMALVAGFPLLSAMCASKWAVAGFTQSVAAELKPEWNVKLTTVVIGALDTEAHEKSKHCSALLSLH